MQLQDGFTRIDKNCDIYKNARAFLRLGMQDALSIFKIAKDSSSEIKCKSSLVTAYTGLELLLKSLLKFSVDSEDQMLILSSKLEIKFTCEGIKIEPKGETTVYRNELLNRLETLGYDVTKDFKNKITHVANIRNEIIHEHTDKPYEMIITAILDIFEVINSIVDDTQSALFWEQGLWDSLCKEENTKNTLKQECLASYTLYNFKPNRYFKCIECESELLKIIQHTDLEFVCKRCNENFTKSFLIDELIKSSNFAYTHKIISFLSSYLPDKLNEQERGEVLLAKANNSQVGFLYNDGDDDIKEFYDNKCFGYL